MRSMSDVHKKKQCRISNEYKSYKLISVLRVLPNTKLPVAILFD